MADFALIGASFGIGYAWVNLGRRLHPIGMAEVFWGGEPTIREDGTYSDVWQPHWLTSGEYVLLYRANDGEVLHGGTFRTKGAAKAWRP